MYVNGIVYNNDKMTKVPLQESFICIKYGLNGQINVRVDVGNEKILCWRDDIISLHKRYDKWYNYLTLRINNEHLIDYMNKLYNVVIRFHNDEPVNDLLIECFEKVKKCLEVLYVSAVKIYKKSRRMKNKIKFDQQYKRANQ